MKNKNRAKKKHLKNLKRKKKALQMRQQQAMANNISTGVQTLYHFTSQDALRGIKKYGLVMGNVICGRYKTTDTADKNAVNLTEESHYHDPSHNGSSHSLIRIEVRMNTKDLVNAKQHAKATNTLHYHRINDGNVSKHWYYFGQIKVEDFVEVCMWTGSKYEKVNIDSFFNIFSMSKRVRPSIHNARLCGALFYDVTGYALKASNTYFEGEEYFTNIVALTDAVNRKLVNTKHHRIWQDCLTDLFHEGKSFSEEMTWTVIWALIFAKEFNVQIPTQYLNSKMEKVGQYVDYAERFMNKFDEKYKEVA